MADVGRHHQSGSPMSPHIAHSGAHMMSPTTDGSSSVNGSSTPDESHIGLSEKGKREDGGYVEVYPKNSFDVYGDEEKADSE
jgi:hypothetical protein